MFAIEKNIPMPTTGRSGRRTSYPFGDMEVGDSFVVPTSDKKATSVYSAAWHYGNKNGKKFSVHKIEGGVRVWRVA